jgi:hypothetical protein
MSTTNFESLKELQLALPRILEQHGANADLTRIALVNPIVALQRAGYTFSAAAQQEIEQHIRFGKEGAEKFRELSSSLHGLLGKNIPLDDADKVAAAIGALTGKDKQQAEKELTRYRQLTSSHRALAPEKDIHGLEGKMKKGPFSNVVFSMNRKKDTPAKKA